MSKTKTVSSWVIQGEGKSVDRRGPQNSFSASSVSEQDKTRRADIKAEQHEKDEGGKRNVTPTSRKAEEHRSEALSEKAKERRSRSKNKQKREAKRGRRQRERRKSR